MYSNGNLAACGEPAISLYSHHVSLVQWTTRLLPITRNPGSNPLGGYLCETGILLLALSRYIGDPDVIDHHGLVWGGLRPKPSLGPCADNVIIPLDLTHACCGSPFRLHNRRSRLLGGSPVEILQSHSILTMSHHVSLVQWTNPLLPVTRDLGSNPLGGTYVKPGFSC